MMSAYNLLMLQLREACYVVGERERISTKIRRHSGSKVWVKNESNRRQH